jgi:hypothetical protein
MRKQCAATNPTLHAENIFKDACNIVRTTTDKMVVVLHVGQKKHTDGHELTV